jgi:hypothetical protein
MKKIILSIITAVTLLSCSPDEITTEPVTEPVIETVFCEMLWVNKTPYAQHEFGEMSLYIDDKYRQSTQKRSNSIIFQLKPNSTCTGIVAYKIVEGGYKSDIELYVNGKLVKKGSRVEYTNQ